MRKKQVALGLLGVAGVAGATLGVLALLPLVMKRPEMPEGGEVVDDWTGNCLVVEAQGIYHQVIELFTKSTWTHVFIFLNHDWLIDTTWPHARALKRSEMPEYKMGVIAPDLTLQERQRLAPALWLLVGKRYGLEAIWWFAWSRTLGWRMPGTGHVGDVCSTSLTRAYRHVGLYPRLHLEQGAETVAPSDLARAWGFLNPVHTRRRSLREMMASSDWLRVARVDMHRVHPEIERRRQPRLGEAADSLVGTPGDAPGH